MAFKEYLEVALVVIVIGVLHIFQKIKELIEPKP